MPTLPDAVLLDLATVGICLAALVRWAKLGHSHPATIYLLFHGFAFSWRLLALAGGGVPLFAEPYWGPNIEPLGDDELARAALVADGVLFALTVAWLFAARRERLGSFGAGPAWFSAPLNHRIVYWVSAVAFPVGIVALFMFARLPGIDNTANYLALGDWDRSSYVLILQSWAGLALIAVVYVKGFRPWLVAMVLAFLAVMVYQGFHRFRAVIPALLLVQIYLDRSGLRWPGLRMSASLLAVALVFFPLKDIGRALQRDAPLVEVQGLATESISEAMTAKHADQLFLDELAAGLSLVDAADACFYGAPYLAVLTLPVPRQIWPDKPTLNAAWRQIDRPSRPVVETGMVVTFIGDLYANFSYAGLFVMAPLLAYLLGRFYFLAQRAGYWSIGHFAYLLLACNLLQVYRDGLVSVFMFTVVNMLPLSAIVALHFPRPWRALATSAVAK